MTDDNGGLELLNMNQHYHEARSGCCHDNIVFGEARGFIYTGPIYVEQIDPHSDSEDRTLSWLASAGDD